jgi:tetratricopeptide (TPR) repeat protein
MHYALFRLISGSPPRNFCLLLLLILASLQGTAQKPNTDPTGDEKWARAYLMAGDFVTALKEYQLLIKKDSTNPEYNYNLATCYLNTSINKAKALPYMEFASRQPKMDPIVQYDLGRAYQIVYRFDEAIEAFTKYKTLISGEDMNYISADMQIEMCRRAKEMMLHPVNVTFENLGARVNSPSPDYSPYINAGETMLHFTSKRAGNVGNLVDYDGYYTADLFYVEFINNQWDKAKRLANTINTPLIEEMAGLSEDASHIFAYVDNLTARYQILEGTRSGRSFQYLQPMGEAVNPKNEGATAVTVFRDRKAIIFAAERQGGAGGSDLFISRKLPNGIWGTPVSLGPTINTDFDEDYPHLSADNQRLYFASIGHGSMGGYDIFYSDWDSVNQRWNVPVNLGYPVNTPDDNVQISFTASGRYAYTSALRPEGYGNLDIYRIVFHDVEPVYTMVHGNILQNDSVSLPEAWRNDIQIAIDTLKSGIDSAVIAVKHLTEPEINAIRMQIIAYETMLNNGPSVKISVQDTISGKITGTYMPNRRTGHYLMFLPPGTFRITITCDAYHTREYYYNLPETEANPREVLLNLTLKKSE